MQQRTNETRNRNDDALRLDAACKGHNVLAIRCRGVKRNVFALAEDGRVFSPEAHGLNGRPHLGAAVAEITQHFTAELHGFAGVLATQKFS